MPTSKSYGQEARRVVTLGGEGQRVSSDGKEPRRG